MSLTPTSLYCSEWGCQQIEAHKSYTVKAGGVRRLSYCPACKGYFSKKKRLQQRLDVYWILHNFARVHFTTKHVPAVALGITEQGLSLAEIFSYPYAFGIKRNQCRLKA